MRSFITRTVIFILLMTLHASLAGATTIVAPPDEHFPYQEWANSFLVPSVPVTIAIHEEQGPCAEALGCATNSDIYLPSAPWIDRASMRQIFAHEMGHVFDFQVLTDQDRAMFESFAYLGGPWDQPSPSAVSPREVFAEAYAFCARRPLWRIRGSASVGPYLLGRVALRRICQWMRGL